MKSKYVVKRKMIKISPNKKSKQSPFKKTKLLRQSKAKSDKDTEGCSDSEKVILENENDIKEVECD